MLNRVSIRTLAEFVHRKGDLYPALGGRVTGEQGIAAQRRAQANRPPSYRREASVERTFERSGVRLQVSGRLDGCDLDAPVPLVEEIKTTRAEPVDAERQLGSAHWAQAQLYAALLSIDHPERQRWHLRLLYCHPTKPEQNAFDRIVGSDELSEFLDGTLTVYCRWLEAQVSYARDRDRWLSGREFPYGDFRPHQRALAGRVFRALSTAEHLLLESPTGSGKTMGVLYPALKALATGRVQRLFYLTSRGTGSLAVMKACQDVGQGADQIRVVELVAKEKVCPVPGMPCDASCSRQTGYYERLPAAVDELLARRIMNRAEVQEVATHHHVCPFELSLDASVWADLVVGDYNYLFDPVVRLQRFGADPELGLLIDESHQLADRVRDMLSLTLDRSHVRQALAESPPRPLRQRLRGLDRALLAMRRAHVTDLEAAPDRENVIPPPDGVLRAMGRALETLADDLLDLTAYPETRQLIFTLSRWERSASWAGTTGCEPPFRYLLNLGARPGKTRELTLRLVCLDCGPYLSSIFGCYGGHVRFSGTVTPMPLYQTLHGMPEAPAERVQNAFDPAQMATLVVNDLPVYFRQRARTLPRLVELIESVCTARPGNYLVALPSFEYLEQLAAALSKAGPGLSVCKQHPGMTDPEREAFLAAFSDQGETRIGLIVLGGVFGESVDFSHAPLSGVICIGVGVPPGSRQRTEMARYFDQRIGPGGGTTVAYLQPAMTKILQMAGRLLRGPEDRGILCLVDDRFARPDYQRFFPEHWRPVLVGSQQVAGRVHEFWRTSAELPRLPGSAGASDSHAVETLV